MTILKRFLMGAVLCILLPVFFGCNNSGAFIDPFIGTWEGSDGKFWKFRINGTGGKASTKDGPFGDDFSFFVYDGQGVQLPPPNKSLVIIEIEEDDYTRDDVIRVTRYEFTIAGKQAELIPKPSGANITLNRLEGRPQPLKLDNLLIGIWAADWDGDHGVDWSLEYRTDGTAKLFHQKIGHQFENGYAVRRYADREPDINTDPDAEPRPYAILVIFGYMRFGAFGGPPIIANIFPIEDLNHLDVVEIIDSSAVWEYFKDPNAPWLPDEE